MFQHHLVHVLSAVNIPFLDSQTKDIKDSDHKSLLSSEQRKIQFFERYLCYV